MILEITQRKADVCALCRIHRVKRLEVFGSAVDGTFNPDKSDLDFLVEYMPLEPGAHYEFYFGLLENLEVLFGRKVDLVDGTCLRNPYFIEAVTRSRTFIYDAKSEELPET